MKRDLAAFAPRRILVCQQRQIGDALLAAPALELLKKRFPRADLHLFTEAKCEPLLRGNPHIDKLLLLDRRKPARPMGSTGLVSPGGDRALRPGRGFSATAALPVC